jgi:hypothetical protein
MHFAIINPIKKETVVVDCVSESDAYKIAGLSSARVDHGVIVPGIGIVIYEFGLFTPPSEQSYFAINGHLYAGVAVLYAFNKEGRTVSLQAVPPVVFMPNAEAVERSIQLGLVQRPQITVNGETIWEWPQPRPRSLQ